MMSIEDTTEFSRPGARLPVRLGPAPTAHDRRLDRLIGRLPLRLQKAVRRLRAPSMRWVRIPAGILLIAGGCLAILPVFGLWMIPLGLILLAEDMPPLRRLRERSLAWAERRWPRLFSDRA